MQVYVGGSVVSFNLPFELSLPISASYSLVDENGAFVVQDVDVPVYADDTFVTIEVASEHNDLAGKGRSLRVLTLKVHNDSGESVQVQQSYILVANLDLTIPGQSFQTVGESTLNAMDMPRVEQFEAAPDFLKRKALIEAALRINSLAFDLSSRRNGQSYISDFFDDQDFEIQDLSHDEWLGLDSKFKDALIRAQIAEANDILGGNPIEEQRKAGLFSHTVSESKHMYRSGKPVELAVGSRAMRYLSGYLKPGGRIRIGRG